MRSVDGVPTRIVVPLAARVLSIHGHGKFQGRRFSIDNHAQGRRRNINGRLNCLCAVTHSAKQSTSCPVDLPATYCRLIARKTGNNFREVAEVEQVPLQLPGENEVLVRVSYVGINGGCELFRSRGDFSFRSNHTASHYLLGAEGAGVVMAVGEDVKNCKVGQAVTFGGGVGAFSEYVRLKSGSINIVEEASPQAVALALSGTVACTALKDIGGIQRGDVVLVSAAAGGTGHLAVQVAQLAGARVVAVTGRDDKAQRLRQLGVDRVINYKKEDVCSVLSTEFPEGINVAYEGVGGDIFKAAWKNLAPGGRLLLLGYISEYPHTGCPSEGSSSVDGLPPLHTLFWETRHYQRDGKTIYAQTMPKDPSIIPERRHEMFELYRQGKIQVWVDDSAHFFGVGSIPDAVDHMLSGTTIGKVVAQIS